MPAKILECTKVELHPNADSLRVYNFSDGTNIFQIIANPTNIYAVGDKAAIALIGSVLKDDTEIKESKIRGILSQGMALGKSDLPIGTDVTNDFCHSEDIKLDGSNPQLVRWASIENLYNIRKEMGGGLGVNRRPPRFHASRTSETIFPSHSVAFCVRCMKRSVASALVK